MGGISTSPVGFDELIFRKGDGSVLEGTSITASTLTDVKEIPEGSLCLLYVDIGAVSGTSPTMDGIVQVRLGSGATWAQYKFEGTNIALSQAIASNTAFSVAFFWAGESLRVSLVLGGTTPSFQILKLRLLIKNNI